MKRILALTFAVLVLGYLPDLSASASTNTSNVGQSCGLLQRVLTFDADANNRLKDRLPSIFFLKTSLDCTPCCEVAETSYQNCRRQRDRTTCDCIRLSYENCLFAGCGPCLCCQDWYTRGVYWQCW